MQSFRILENTPLPYGIPLLKQPELHWCFLQEVATQVGLIVTPPHAEILPKMFGQQSSFIY